MQTIVGTIYFELSPAGQKAALLSGHDAAKFQVIAGDIRAEDLNLCRIMPDGVVLCVTYDIYASRAPESLYRYRNTLDNFLGIGNNLNTVRITVPFDAPPASSLDAMDIVRAAVEANRAADAQIQRNIAEGNAKLIAARQARIAELAAIVVDIQARMDADPAVIPDFPSTWNCELNHPVAVEIRRRRNAAEEIATAERIASQRAWLMAHGQADQIARYDANLLPANEFAAAVADHAFGALSAFQPFNRITPAEVREAAAERYDDDEDYAEMKAYFRTSDPRNGLTAEQWATLQALRAACPGATIEPVLHQGTLESDNVLWNTVERLGATATAELDGIKVRREYGL